MPPEVAMMKVAKEPTTMAFFLIFKRGILKIIYRGTFIRHFEFTQHGLGQALGRKKLWNKIFFEMSDTFKNNNVSCVKKKTNEKKERIEKRYSPKISAQYTPVITG